MGADVNGLFQAETPDPMSLLNAAIGQHMDGQPDIVGSMFAKLENQQAVQDAAKAADDADVERATRNAADEQAAAEARQRLDEMDEPLEDDFQSEEEYNRALLRWEAAKKDVIAKDAKAAKSRKEEGMPLLRVGNIREALREVNDFIQSNTRRGVDDRIVGWYKQWSTALRTMIHDSVAQQASAEISQKLRAADTFYAEGITEVNKGVGELIQEHLGKVVRKTDEAGEVNAERIVGTGDAVGLINALINRSGDMDNIRLAYKILGGADSEAVRSFKRMFVQQFFEKSLVTGKSDNVDMLKQTGAMKAGQLFQPDALQKLLGAYTRDQLEVILGKDTVDNLYRKDMIQKKMEAYFKVKRKQDLDESSVLRKVRNVWPIVRRFSYLFAPGSIGLGVAQGYMIAWLASVATLDIARYVQKRVVASGKYGDEIVLGGIDPLSKEGLLIFRNKGIVDVAKWIAERQGAMRQLTRPGQETQEQMRSGAEDR